MNHINRVKTALNHQEPDRVPWDFWATPEIEAKLVSHLGLANIEEVLRHLDVDLRYYRGPSYVGRELRKFDDGTSEDLWGVVRKSVQVDTGVYQWTYSHVVKSPLEDAQSAVEVHSYTHWPTADMWDYSRVEEDCASFPGYAVVYAGDRLDRTAQLKPAMYLRGMEQIYVDMSCDPDIADAIFARIRDYFIPYNDRVFAAAKGKIDIFMMGDDFGNQNSPLVSVGMWRRFFKPGFKAFIEVAHRHGIKVMHHTCGAVKDLIPDFIDCGLDILQSVQPRAHGMDLGGLKREFGKDLCFHGSMDIQHTIPHGTRDDIRAEVKARMQTGKSNGGFIISTAHNIQPDTPIENVLALFEAYREFGEY